MSFPRSVPDGQYSDGGFVQSSQYSYSSGQSTAFPQTDYNQQQYSPPGPPGPPGTMNDQGFSSGNQFQNQQQNQFPNQQQNQFQNPQQNQFQTNNRISMATLRSMIALHSIHWDLMDTHLGKAREKGTKD
ncbi:hypothetical protein ANCDUO_13754 [Ancylostoma duodenale]|uniref:Uncharacterized protein n=1 Tax=Ancylostoma duodenale TaxID=51022 RepID=A0A0C2GAZ0_9BILA|nr:hypothetical protein ANCDUO_13754 [Ancylostoma duodenale]